MVKFTSFREARNATKTPEWDVGKLHQAIAKYSGRCAWQRLLLRDFPSSHIFAAMCDKIVDPPPWQMPFSVYNAEWVRLAYFMTVPDSTAWTSC
jgi:hypothetical protein